MGQNGCNYSVDSCSVHIVSRLREGMMLKLRISTEIQTFTDLMLSKTIVCNQSISLQSTFSDFVAVVEFIVALIHSHAGGWMFCFILLVWNRVMMMESIFFDDVSTVRVYCYSVVIIRPPYWLD